MAATHAAATPPYTTPRRLRAAFSQEQDHADQQTLLHRFPGNGGNVLETAAYSVLGGPVTGAFAWFMWGKIAGAMK